MAKFKAKEDYSNTDTFMVTQILDKVADGITANPTDFPNSPQTPIELREFSTNMIRTHEAAFGGNHEQQVESEIAIKAGVDALGQMGRYANNVCNGSEILFTKLGIIYYDASGNGGKASAFSLSQGPDSGQLWITVPRRLKNDAYIAMFSLEESTPLLECSMAGGSNRVKFLLTNLPVAKRIFIRWARITSQGITEWSEPYPIIVS